jgi:hypothetical protein
LLLIIDIGLCSLLLTNWYLCLYGGGDCVVGVESAIIVI